MDDWYGLWMTGMADWHGRLAWMTGVHGLSWTEFYILITDRQTNRRTDIGTCYVAIATENVFSKMCNIVFFVLFRSHQLLYIINIYIL